MDLRRRSVSATVQPAHSHVLQLVRSTSSRTSRAHSSTVASL